MHPAAGGSELRIENSIIALSKLADVHIVSRASKNQVGGEVAEEFYRGYSSSYSYSPSTKPNAGWPSSIVLRAINKACHVLLKIRPIKIDLT